MLFVPSGLEAGGPPAGLGHSFPCYLHRMGINNGLGQGQNCDFFWMDGLGMEKFV